MFNISRRISYVIFATVLATLAVVICFFIEQYTKSLDLNSDISFSHESGFYDNPIEVELSVGDIYYITYTLDGSAPTAEGQKYENPILITDASYNDNVWSIMEETSLRYFEPEYYVPNYKIDKCAVLRAAAFDYSGKQVSSDVREYFIGFENKAGYEGMYNLCVSTDPDNLFSDEYGIYTAGEYWRGKIDSCKVWDMFDRGGDNWDGPGRYANWEWSGKDAERPATIELFNPQGDLLVREDCGVRISGKGSRNEPQKSLKFIARESYSGESKFPYDLFGEGENPGSFLIHSFGDDFYVKIIDYVVYAALRNGQNGYKYTQTIPCNLFLEGEYWGPMFLEKPVSSEIIAENFNLDEDNIILIKTNEVKLGEEFEKLKEAELGRWEDFQEFIREEDMSLSENYEYVCSIMDVEDFAEYSAIQIYTSNSEWHLRNNFACWRTMKEEKGNLYSDGKWRFCLFDVNGAFASEETIWEYMDEDWDTWYMVKSLCKNDEFKKLYLEKISEVQELFAKENVEPIIDEWSEVMEEPIRCHFKRFRINGDADERITNERNMIIDFCEKRPEEIKKVNEWFFE